MTQRPTYVGVTGFMDRKEVDLLLNDPMGKPTEETAKLMIGVLASSATMRGEKGKWPGRYPSVDAIKSIFPAHPHTLNLIHYATDDASTLGDQLIALTRRVDSTAMHGYQLNVAWPHPAQLEKFFVACGLWRIVLQIGTRASLEAGDDPVVIARRVESYGPLIDHVLIDGSGGRGIPLDPVRIRPFVDALYDRLGHRIGIGVAGGIGPFTPKLVLDLLYAYPDLSVDAEGALRDPKDDSLDMFITPSYTHLMNGIRSSAQTIARLEEMKRNDPRIFERFLKK